MKPLYKIAALFFKLYQFFYQKGRAIEQKTLPQSELNKEKWYADNQEKELRYNYILDDKSLVIDVGGYEGDFASEIYSRYLATIYVFEPVKKYITYLEKRFQKNNYIRIIPKGLGAKSEQLTIHVMDEASSYNRSASIHKKGIKEAISIIDITEFIKETSIIKIDLIKINIEGAEYDLLDRMIEENLLIKCVNLQIQFHDFYPNFTTRYNTIKTALQKTHQLTYSYPFVWENWQLKKQ